MKKKILSIALVVCIAVTAIAGATLAYLTDRDSEVNEFTWGNVEIDLIEKFEDDSTLLPGIKVEKEVTVKNIGKNSAWVWVKVAIPAALDSVDDASKNVLHMNVPGRFWDDYRDNKNYWLEDQESANPIEICWNVDFAVDKDVEINSVKYNVYTHLYCGPLAVDKTTTTCLTDVYLDAHVDVSPEGDLYWVDNGEATKLNWNLETNGEPKVYVSAYAIQQAGFATVEEAYAAYNTQWGENGAEYATPSSTETETEENTGSDIN